MKMAKKESGRWRPGGARQAWTVGQRQRLPAAVPPAVQPVAPVIVTASEGTSAGTILVVFLGLGVVTVGILELAGVTHLFGPPPGPPAKPAAAAPAAGTPAAQTAAPAGAAAALPAPAK